jgi:DNA (cytosine-5)-methyltransferase 1
VDLFAGAGGLSLGLENAGYTVVMSVDHDAPSVETHMANFPGLCLDLDLADPERVDDLVELLSGLDIDLIAGGPPCQPFSRAGRSKIRDLVDKGIRERVDPRQELWRSFLRVVEEVRPGAALMENVPDMALGDDMRTVRFIADRLESAGYETEMQILETWRYGVPQHRQRLILVALREGLFEWPKERDQVTLRDAIDDLPALRNTSGSREMRYRGPRSVFQARARLGVATEDANLIFDHFTRPVRDDDREAFELMAKGATYPDLPDHLKRYRDDIFDDKYNRLRWDDWSRSITAHISKDGYWYIHPKEHRTLTVREAARIQTFPDRFRFSGVRSDAFRQIGNAVPPVLAEVVAVALREAGSRSRPTGELLPSEVRAAVRTRALAWADKGQKPAWRRVGDPWAVLVGTLAGRGREQLGNGLVGRFPTPDAVVPQQLSAQVRRAADEREARILRAVNKAATALRREGWDSGAWAKAAGLGPADRLWVEAVGLGQKHVAVTAGTLRVAARVEGNPEASGVAVRMLLARIVGYSDTASDVTAAIAGLAADVCTPVVPECSACPLQPVCASASGVPLTIDLAGGRAAPSRT